MTLVPTAEREILLIFILHTLFFQSGVRSTLTPLIEFPILIQLRNYQQKILKSQP